MALGMCAAGGCSTNGAPILNTGKVAAVACAQLRATHLQYSR